MAKETKDTEKVKSFLRETMTTLVKDEKERAFRLSNPPPPNPKKWIDVLSTMVSGHRDAPLALMAFPTCLRRQFDLTDRFDGDRAASNELGEVLADLKIPAVKSALQNSTYRHGTTHARIKNPEAARLLEWASQAPLDDVESAFYYLAAKVAATAKNLPPMAPIDKFLLSWDRCTQVVDVLLSTPSQGAYHQFLFAGWLRAWVDSLEEGARVVTKSLFGSDSSAGTAGDVQVVKGQADVRAAYEVTANEWDTKLRQAAGVLRAHALQSVTILAGGTPPSPAELRLKMAVENIDLPPGSEIAVLNVRDEILSLIHRVQNKTLRELAFATAYEYLSGESNPDLLRQFNDALRQAGVSDNAASETPP